MSFKVERLEKYADERRWLIGGGGKYEMSIDGVFLRGLSELKNAFLMES